MLLVIKLNDYNTFTNTSPINVAISTYILNGCVKPKIINLNAKHTNLFLQKNKEE